MGYYECDNEPVELSEDLLASQEGLCSTEVVSICLERVIETITMTCVTVQTSLFRMCWSQPCSNEYCDFSVPRTFDSSSEANCTGLQNQ
jgi:hypothetical protein